MKSSPATLIVDRDQWRLMLGNKDSNPVAEGPWTLATASEAAEAVAQRLSELSPKTRRLAILLGTSLCMTARFRMDSARQARKREALLYKIEEQIPVAAEDLVADFSRRGLQIYAVAAERSHVAPLIDSLRDQGIGIDLVSPLAPLAWEQHLAIGKRSSRDAVAWIDDNQEGELVVFADDQPTTWTSLPSANGPLKQQLSYHRLGSTETLPLVVYAPRETLGDDVASAMTGSMVDVRTTGPDPLRAQALKTLSSVRSGRSSLAFDLTPGFDPKSASHNPLAIDTRLLHLAVLVLLAALVFSNIMASRQLEADVDRLVVAQEDVFRDVFPDARLPRGIRARLESEYAKLAGARGETEDEGFGGSILPLVARLLQAMPEEMRFRLLDIKIEENRLDLVGEVRDFGDADQIAASLRREGFQVKPPTTQRLPEKGVNFRLRAEYVPLGTSPEAVDE